jgi:hypothetical protein
MSDNDNAKTPETEKKRDNTKTPQTENGGNAARVTNDTGVPQGLERLAIYVGLGLIVVGVIVSIFPDSKQLGVLTTCVGFGITLAAFGSRAAGGWKKLSATGSGALAIGLFFIYQQYAVGPIKFEKRGKIDGDFSKVNELRIFDDDAFYMYTDRNTNTRRFIILDKQFKSTYLTMKVDTNESGIGKEFFEMRGDALIISKRYLAKSHHEVIQWTFDYAKRVVTDRNGCVSQIVLLGGRIKDFGTVSFDDRNRFAEIVA